MAKEKQFDIEVTEPGKLTVTPKEEETLQLLHMIKRSREICQAKKKSN